MNRGRKWVCHVIFSVIMSKYTLFMHRLEKFVTIAGSIYMENQVGLQSGYLSHELRSCGTVLPLSFAGIILSTSRQPPRKPSNLPSPCPHCSQQRRGYLLKFKFSSSSNWSFREIAKHSSMPVWSTARGMSLATPCSSRVSTLERRQRPIDLNTSAKPRLICQAWCFWKGWPSRCAASPRP